MLTPLGLGDEITVIVAAGAVFSAVCCLVGLLADLPWPRVARHAADRGQGPTSGAPADTRPIPRGGADVPRWIVDTRPIPPLVVDSPPGARGVLPAPDEVPVERRWSCGLCHDGHDVIGPECVWCGAQPVMQP